MTEELKTITSQKESNRFLFTEPKLEALPFATDGKQVMYYDTKSKLAIRVGARKKTYCVMKRPPGSLHPIRHKIADMDDLPLGKARLKADAIVGDIALGEDVNEGKREAREKAKQEKIAVEIQETQDKETVLWLLEKYRDDWLVDKRGGKDSTLKSWDDAVKFFQRRESVMLKLNSVTEKWEVDKTVILEDWLSRPFRSITRKEVRDRFEVLRRSKRARGGLVPMSRTYQLAFKQLHAAYRFVIKRTELEERGDMINPVEIVTDFGYWQESKSRTGQIAFNTDEGPIWWNAVTEYETRNLVAALYLKFSVLQCGRSIEIHKLKWTDVNMKDRTVTYFKTKNGDEYKLCITDYALEILKRLKEVSRNDYVFYYPESALGYIPKDGKQHFKNIFRRGAKLISHHDLRRSWATVANLNELNINSVTRDYCLKHKLQGVDKNYFIRNEPEIMASMQKVETYILNAVVKHKHHCRESSKEAA